MGAYNKEWAKSVYESTGYITLPYYKNYLTPNEQLKLYKNICKLYLDENKTEQEVMTLLNINPTCLKYIKKLYKIHKSKDLFSDRMKKSLKNMSDEQKLKANNKRIETTRNKYGSNNISQSNYFREKVKQTWENKSEEELNEIKQKMKTNCLEKYGYESFSQVPEIKQKVKQTWENKSEEELNEIKQKQSQAWKNKSKEELNEIEEKRKKSNLDKYGVNFIMQLNSSKNKSKQTKLEKYGDENYHNIEKAKETNLERYGFECYFQTSEFKEKFKQAMLKKYKVDHDWKSDKVKEKIKQTNLEKYGYKYASQSPEVKEKVIHTNLERYNVEWFCFHPSCKKVSSANSKINQRFAKLLEENEINFEQECKIQLKSYDFKVGNILIEINPSYTHSSSSICHFPGSKPTYINYHLEKSKLAQENEFFCIHVWDWDNWNKIVNLLIPKKTVFARNCELKEVNKKECDEFLNTYHLQNSCNGQKICYGLYHNNVLVELMTFGKPRYNKNYEWELLRLCSHKDYKIVGGSERLFKHFLKEQNPQSIISYCDNSKFSGEVYKRLGFILKSKGGPSCNWSKGKEKITNNLLMQRGYDQLFGTSYGKGTSNKDLMIQNGWREVYDCGQSVWIYKV